MNTKLSKLAVMAGIAITLAASALPASAVVVTPLGDAQFKPIHAGQKQEEVRSLLGKPNVELKDRHGGGFEWEYSYRDAFGYESEFDVYFDANGVVKDTYSQRVRD